jgi:hypothetical protein
MDLGSVFLGLGLALIVAAILARPLLAGGETHVQGQDTRLSALQAERDRILTRLQELDMDAAMGKVLQDDYEHERTFLMQQGAGVLREIDSYSSLQEGTQLLDQALDAKVEAAIAGIRDELGTAAGFCPACGKPVHVGDQFCTHCGSVIQLEEARS